jgi:hypothetical protein
MNTEKALGVRKPRWISACGWFALVCIVTPFAIPLAEVLFHVYIPRTVIPGLMLVVFWPLFLIWILGTVIHRAQAHQAQLTAAALMKAAQQAALQQRQPGGKP